MVHLNHVCRDFSVDNLVDDRANGRFVARMFKVMSIILVALIIQTRSFECLDQV